MRNNIPNLGGNQETRFLTEAYSSSRDGLYEVLSTLLTAGQKNQVSTTSWRKVLLSIDEKMVQTIFVSGQNREMWVSPECWGKNKQSLYIKGTRRIMVSHITEIKKIQIQALLGGTVANSCNKVVRCERVSLFL